ncbi:MAG: hypothetical protein GWP06_17430 [Actinobacteria bacterium]|nr:hypothetical protein [Actinomycetota bacterium]
MKAFKLIILLIVFAAFSPLKAATIKDEYNSRKQQVLAWADTLQKDTFFAAAVKIKQGHHVKEGVQAFERALVRLKNSPSGMFDIYNLMGSYLAVQDKMDNSLKAKVRQALATGDFYRGDTENHLTIYYIGLYLAAQTFPNLPAEDWYTGRSASDNKREAESWLKDWMEKTTTIGQGEFDSPTYMAVYLTSLFGLYQYAADPVMKENARLMLNWLIVDFAVEHLDGMYVGAHSREYPDRLIDQYNPQSLMTGWGWLFFGQAPPLFNETMISAALSDFVLSDIIYHIGTDRSHPYVHTETKRVRNIIRFGDERNPPVYKYTYMTKDYALGSMMGGGILQPIQQHTWDVSFVTKSPRSIIFTVHPFIGEKDLGMFFPEEMKFSIEEVSRFHTFYGKEGKWSSSSPYEETFQHKNAIIVLYNIPKGTTFGHIDGFFPKDLDARVEDPSGWIFCRANNTFIAYFPLQPYKWIEEDVCYRLRSYKLKNGCIVEVAEADDYPSFAAFQKQIKKNNLVHDIFEKTMMVSYTTSAGDVMTFTYDGPRQLNGKKINFADYKLFRGPFLNAEMKSRKLDIHYKNKGMVLDMATEKKGLILPEVMCKKVSREPVLSGKMDDPLWQSAPAVKLNDAITGDPGRYDTKVRLLYDDKYLYVGFSCQDDYIWGTLTEREDPIWDEECVEVFLNPANSKHQYYEINVSPKNTMFDACIVNDRTPENSERQFKSLPEWNAKNLRTVTHIKGEVDIPGKGKSWTAEFAIPLEELYGAENTPPKSGDVWRVNFYRIDSPKKGKQEYYAWSKTEGPAFHLPWRFGYLKF